MAFDERKGAQPNPEIPKEIDISIAREQLDAREADLRLWQDGAQAFKSMWSGTNIAAVPENIGQVQALYLGERGVIFDDIYGEDLAQAMISDPNINFSQGNGFIYRPDIVQRIIDEHRDVFGDVSADEFMRMLERGEDDKYAEETGYLLGFPAQDVKDYAAGVWRYQGPAKILYGEDNQSAMNIPQEDQDFLYQLTLNQPIQNPEIAREKLLSILMRARTEGVITKEDAEKTVNAFDITSLGNGEKAATVNICGIEFAHYGKTKPQVSRLAKAFLSSGILLPEQMSQAAQARAYEEESSEARNEANEVLAYVNQTAERIGEAKQYQSIASQQSFQDLEDRFESWRTNIPVISSGLSAILEAKNISKILPGSEDYENVLASANAQEIRASRELYDVLENVMEEMKTINQQLDEIKAAVNKN